MPYNSSAARVLVPSERDYPAAPKPQLKPKSYPAKLKVVSRSKASGKTLSFVTIKTVVTFALVVVGICIMLYNQVQLNEINGEIKAINSEITTLQSEYVRMQSSLESTLSYRNVEKQAEEELGLQRIDPAQVEYLYIYEEDKVEVFEAAAPEGFSAEVEAFTASIVNGVINLFNNDSE